MVSSPFVCFLALPTAPVRLLRVSLVTFSHASWRKRHIQHVAMDTAQGGPSKAHLNGTEVVLEGLPHGSDLFLHWHRHLFISHVRLGVYSLWIIYG